MYPYSIGKLQCPGCFKTTAAIVLRTIYIIIGPINKYSLRPVGFYMFAFGLLFRMVCRMYVLSDFDVGPTNKDMRQGFPNLEMYRIQWKTYSIRWERGSAFFYQDIQSGTEELQE